MVSPDELDAMITSAGNSSSIELLLEVDPLGPVLLDQVRAYHGSRQIAGEGETRLGRAGRETQSLERRPGCLHEVPQRLLGVRCNIGRDDF
jgi:hypothetical protein